MRFSCSYIAVAFSFVFGCSQQPNNLTSQPIDNKAGSENPISGNDQKPHTDTAAPAGEISTVDDERVTPPTPVAGTFLYCVLEENSEILASVHCRLEDKNKKRLSISTLAEAWRFSWEAPTAQSVRIVEPASYPNYDVTYKISGNSASNEAARIRYAVTLEGLLTGEAEVTLSREAGPFDRSVASQPNGSSPGSVPFETGPGSNPNTNTNTNINMNSNTNTNSNIRSN